jgi:molybdopterin converting factor small subunit
MEGDGSSRDMTSDEMTPDEMTDLLSGLVKSVGPQFFAPIQEAHKRHKEKLERTLRKAEEDLRQSQEVLDKLQGDLAEANKRTTMNVSMSEYMDQISATNKTLLENYSQLQKYIDEDTMKRAYSADRFKENAKSMEKILTRFIDVIKSSDTIDRELAILCLGALQSRLQSIISSF